MAIGDGLVALLVLGFWIFCLFDVITTDESLMRNLSKTWWIVIVLFLSVVGSIMWLVAGRPQGEAGAGITYRGHRGQTRDGSRFGPPARAQGNGLVGAAPRQLAPDDDPEFLESVRKQNAEDKDLLRRWEDDLRRREEQLRNRPDDDAAGEGPDGGEPTER